jgi:hypothetical protein
VRVFFDGMPTFLLKPYLRAGQTAPGAAFEVLNEGKDLLHGNRAFVKIRHTNPRVLEGIKLLNLASI